MSWSGNRKKNAILREYMPEITKEIVDKTNDKTDTDKIQ